jgi:hypothetical protein
VADEHYIEENRRSQPYHSIPDVPNSDSTSKSRGVRNPEYVGGNRSIEFDDTGYLIEVRIMIIEQEDKFLHRHGQRFEPVYSVYQAIRDAHATLSQGGY